MQAPFPLILLPVNPIKQHAPGECLPVCVKMVLDYLGIQCEYNQLVRTLRTHSGYGTPFSNIQALQKLGIPVRYQTGTWQDLYQALQQGWPSIVPVHTRELAYWENVSVRHAVVVVGMDSEYIYLNDPEFDNAPIQASLGDFDLAWFEQEEVYVILAP